MPLGWGMGVVLSGSMEPELSINDLIIVQATKEIECGDVIVYQTGNSLVVHRVVDVNGETVITKGDANNTADEPFSLDCVKGVVKGRIAQGGRIISLLKSPSVIVMLMILVLAQECMMLHLTRKENQKTLEGLEKEIQRIERKDGNG